MSAAERLLGLRVRIPPVGVDVCVVCCRGISDMRTEHKRYKMDKDDRTKEKRKHEQKKNSDGVYGVFNWHNSSGRSVTLESPQLLI
jgi:hypothetical protein